MTRNSIAGASLPATEYALRALILAWAALLGTLTACSDFGRGSGPARAADLQALVDAAAEGQTVSVPAGTYRGPLKITKPLNLQAAGDGDVTIDADCKADNAIEISASNVTITGLRVLNPRESGVRVDDAADVRLLNMTVLDWNCSGIQAQYSAGVACWYCTRLSVVDSYLETRGAWGNGIWLKGTSDRPSGGGHYFAGNTIIGGMDGIGSEAEDDTQGGFNKDTLIENNRVRDCHDDGIQVEGRNERIVVRANQVSGCGDGIAFAPNLVGPLFIEGNTLSDMRTGIYGLQACFKAGNGGEGLTVIRDNVCRTAGQGIKQTNAGLSPFEVGGNCFSVTDSAFEFGERPSGRFEGDRLWTAPGQRFAEWDGTRFDSLAGLQSAYGVELSGQQVAC